ncbi:replication initiation protein [Anoxynatronum sibiricum]|uniref:Replication initiation protein n=1 Tax=Anoxynatronum sibiricum TaxID=210623 RepID=A0ABU9VX66_9CLOT
MTKSKNNQLDGSNMVAKGHALVRAKGKMGALEQKIALSVISLIDKDDTEFKDSYQIDVKDIQKLTGTTDKNFYKVVKETTSDLMDRKIVIEEEIEGGKKRFFEARYLSSAEHVEGSGTITVTMEKKLKPYLIQLKAFTQFQLQNVLKMKSGYAIKLYELLKQWPKKNNLAMEVNQLREILGIEDDEYDRFYDFEKRVIKTAINEINKHTDVRVHYEKVKRGRNIEKIVFLYETVESDPEKAFLEEMVKKGSYDIGDIKEKCGIGEYKFNAKQVTALYTLAINKFNKDPFGYTKYYVEKMKEKSVKNKFAYLKKALSEDWDYYSYQNR